MIPKRNRARAGCDRTPHRVRFAPLLILGLSPPAAAHHGFSPFSSFFFSHGTTILFKLSLCCRLYICECKWARRGDSCCLHAIYYHVSPLSNWVGAVVLISTQQQRQIYQYLISPPLFLLAVVGYVPRVRHALVLLREISQRHETARDILLCISDAICQ